MKSLIEMFVRSRLWRETQGQDLVEYALLAGFVTVAVGATFPPASDSITIIFSRVQSLMQQV